MCIDGDYLERKVSRRYRITARYVGVRVCVRNFPDNLVGAARQPVICELPMDKDDSLWIGERGRERELHEDKCCETRRQVGRRDKREIERKREKARGDSTICHRVCERLPGSPKVCLLDEGEQKLPGLIYVRT